MPRIQKVSDGKRRKNSGEWKITMKPQRNVDEEKERGFLCGKKKKGGLLS